MVVGLAIMNAGKFARPSKFKAMLLEHEITYDGIVFNNLKGGNIELSFENEEVASLMQSRISQLPNYKGDFFKVLLIKDYEAAERQQKKASPAAKEDEDEELELPRNVFFAAPFRECSYSGERELLVKQKMIRNKLKEQFGRILKGQTLSSDASRSNEELESLKHSPDYLKIQVNKDMVMTLPPIEDVQLQRYYRTKSEFMVKDARVGAFYRNGEEFVVFSAQETRRTMLHPQLVSDICEEIEQFIWKEFNGQIVFKSAGEVFLGNFIVNELIISVASGSVSERFVDLMLGVKERHFQVKRILFNESAQDAFICQILHEIPFYLTINSFFESNLQAAEMIYDHVSSLVPETARTILDGCCGTGTIGFITQKLLRKRGQSIHVIGIDIESDSILAAEKTNGMLNAQNTYICAPLEEELDVIGGCDLAIFDPPRSGLHIKVQKAVRASALRSMIYVSCNPKTLASDLFQLCAEAGPKREPSEPFFVKSIKAFNAFPGCEHVETVVELERWQSEII